MQQWVIYGLIASVLFALNGIIYKVAQQKGNFSPYYGTFVFGFGVILVFGFFFFVWAFGFLAIAIALSQKADIARLAPIYNTNTILAVLMGIIFLKEIPDASGIVKVVSGAILIVIGAILVVI